MADILSVDEMVRRAFVLQAGIGFDAKEVTHLLSHATNRLPVHLQNFKERTIPRLGELISHLPDIQHAIAKKDPVLASEFSQENMILLLKEEQTLFHSLVEDIEDIIDGKGSIDQAKADLDRLSSISKTLFPLFARAKDALIILKAKGAI